MCVDESVDSGQSEFSQHSSRNAESLRFPAASRTPSFRSRQVGHAEPATSAVSAPISQSIVLTVGAPTGLGSLSKNPIFFWDALINSTAASISQPLSRGSVSALGLSDIGASGASSIAVALGSVRRRFPRYLWRVLNFRTSELRFLGLAMARKYRRNAEQLGRGVWGFVLLPGRWEGREGGARRRPMAASRCVPRNSKRSTYALFFSFFLYSAWRYETNPWCIVEKTALRCMRAGLQMAGTASFSQQKDANYTIFRDFCAFLASPLLTWKPF